MTCEVTPTHVTAVAEIGKAIHPLMADGQIEGGTAQGLGYALLEEVVMRDGRMANAQLTNYIIPTPMDAPPIDVVHARAARTRTGRSAPRAWARCRSTARRRP